MKNKIKIILLGLGILGGLHLLGGCNNKPSDVSQPEIAVTNSYIACAVKDLWSEQVDIVSLTPPGMCPGHFDMSPGQMQQLRKCALLLRFDFQNGLDKNFSRLSQQGLQLAEVKSLAGLCIPENYAAICSDVCRILSQHYPERAEKYQQRLEQIRSRTESLEQQAAQQLIAANIKNRKVIASAHQVRFAEWLGLDVVAEFTGQEIATPTNINRCLEKGRENNVKIIIANAQEGVQLAESLGESLGAVVIVFSNFPAKKETFDELVQKNIDMLIAKAQL